MADVSIKIQLQDTIEDVIGGVSADKVTNNVSSIVSKNTQKNDGTPLLSFAPGYIKFDTNGNLVNADGVAGKAILEGAYNGFVFGATNASGEYSVTLTISGSHIDSLIFYGDKLANQFPIEAYLDGDTANKIYSDDNVWAIVFDTSTTSHTVTFTKWNRANYNACFTHIAILRNELRLDKSWIKNIESVSQCTGQPNEIFYGVIANSGSAEIIDRNGELLDYITDGIIENSNLPVSIWANGKQVQEHITNDSDYDTNSITLSLDMTNDFENWDNINYAGYEYPETSKSAYEILVSVLNSIGYQNDYSNNYTGQLIDEMLNKKIIVGNSIDDNMTEMSIKSYLQSIIIEYPYLKADTIKNTIDKFCVLTQLQIYKDDNDKIVFISARPRATSNELLNTIVIPAKCKQSQFSETKILKNKYNKTKFTKTDFYYENGQIGDYQKITYNDFSNSKWEDKTGEIPNKYNYTQTLIYGTAGEQRWYGEIIVEFDFDELICKNMQIVYSPQLFGYTSQTDYSLDNTDGNIYIDLPNVSNRPTIFQPTLGDRYNPKIYTEYNDKQKKVKIHVVSWVGGAIGDLTEYGTRDYYYLTNLNISLKGDKLKYNTIEIENGEGTNEVSFTETNTLIQTDEICSMLSNNILSDYGDGVEDATITISCSNYYDINGNLVKDWSKGEIIQVGDIVRVDKDNEGNSASHYKDGTPRLWRVTGRTFRKQGVPLIDLELQEIRQYFRVIFMNGDEVYATQLVDYGEKATEPTAPTVGTGYAFEGWFTADNQEFNFNTPINQDITLYAKIEPQQISVTYDISPNTIISIERLSSNKKNATIGPITTSDTIYYNDQIKYVVSSSSTYNYIGITINDVDYETANASLPYTITITDALQIKTFIKSWTLISKQTVNVLYPNKAGSATTDVVVNNYNYGEELRVNTTLYLHLKNKITNNIDTLNLYIGQSGSDWLTSPGYVPFGWAVPSSIYESYYPFSIDFEFSPQSADSDITITVTKENADDFVSASSPGMSFYALRKS